MVYDLFVKSNTIEIKDPLYHALVKLEDSWTKIENKNVTQNINIADHISCGEYIAVYQRI